MRLKWYHRLNVKVELGLQRLFGLYVHSCTYWLRPRNRNPLPPHLCWAHIRVRYCSAKLDDISLWPSVKSLKSLLDASNPRILTAAIALLQLSVVLIFFFMNSLNWFLPPETKYEWPVLPIADVHVSTTCFFPYIFICSCTVLLVLFSRWFEYQWYRCALVWHNDNNGFVHLGDCNSCTIFLVLYLFNTASYLPPLRFHCADGC